MRLDTNNNNAPLVSTRLCTLDVCSVDSVEIVNLEEFTEDKEAKIGGVSTNVRGLLKHADAKITFSLPYCVSESSLSIKVRTETTLTTRDTSIEVAHLLESKEQLPTVMAPKSFSMVIPVVDGVSEQTPLLDQFNTSVEPYQPIHHTILISGVAWPSSKKCTWRIRLKVNHFTKEVSLVSISDSVVDVVRIKEGVNNLKELVATKAKALSTTVKEKIEKLRNRNATTTVNDADSTPSSENKEEEQQKEEGKAIPVDDNNNHNIEDETQQKEEDSEEASVFSIAEPSN